jgi:cyanate permease
MRHQQVSLNVWQMVQTSCTYLALAFCAWILLRLINACFWLPGYLMKKRDDEMKKDAEERQKLLQENETVQVSGEEPEVADGQAVLEESKKSI